MANRYPEWQGDTPPAPTVPQGHRAGSLVGFLAGRSAAIPYRSRSIPDCSRLPRSGLRCARTDVLEPSDAPSVEDFRTISRCGEEVCWPGSLCASVCTRRVRAEFAVTGVAPKGPSWSRSRTHRFEHRERLVASERIFDR